MESLHSRNCEFLCREQQFLRLNSKRPVAYESVRFAVGRVVLAKILDPVLADWFGFHYPIANPAELTLDHT